MDEDEQLDNEDACCLVLDEFKHHDEVMSIMDGLKNAVNNLNLEESLMEKAKRIFDLYQEQPHLLDPYLGKFLQLSLGMARHPAQYLSPDSSPKEQSKLRHLSFTVLYLLSKTRGYKVLVRLLPHEVSDLEPALNMLENEDPYDAESFESRYMLLLWLSIVSLIPFDLSRLDAGSSHNEGGGLMQRLLAQAKKYLFCRDGKCHAAAAFFLSHFLSRPDVVKAGLLVETINWACDTIKGLDLSGFDADRTAESMFCVLACLFKYGKRMDLLPFASQPILEAALQVDVLPMRHILLKKMKCKLLQRVALIHLPPKVAVWRYDRGQRSLVDNLSLRKTEHNEQQSPACSQGDENGMSHARSQEPMESEDDAVEVPDDVNEVVDYLLNALRDKDTMVRWSAAKGLGRICNRLSKTQVDDVIEAALQLFSRLEPHAAWHGACLALAELSRRGLLLPHRLTQVMPLLLKSLFYDEQSGDCGFGANVRDAACYVCWSFARAYGPAELAPIMTSLAESLVLVTLFDREVNVRRAAAAAFQEHVGRQGQFTHGIDILTTCDYFAVGRRQHSYVELSVSVAQFEEYRVPMINHLLEYKLGHWDVKIRELAARSLNVLTPFAKEHVLTNVLPFILKAVTGLDVLLRHGALMGSAEVLFAFKGHSHDEEILTTAKQIIEKLQEAQQFRGAMGEHMRCAMCQYIRRAAQVQLPFRSMPVVRLWRAFLFECLQQNNPKAQEAAVGALGDFVATYIYTEVDVVDEELKSLMQDGLLQPIGETTYEWVQTGCARGIGATPAVLWTGGRVEQALHKLLSCCSHTADPRTEKWGDARVEALTALTNFLEHLGVIHPELAMPSAYTEVLQALLLALEDYTVSNRGDIGSRVREAGMREMARIVPMLLAHGISQSFTHDCSRDIFGKILQQAVEKIDRTRGVACDTLFKLLHHNPPLPNVPHMKELLTHFPKELCEQKVWSSASESYPVFASLLHLDEYRVYLLQGLVVSVGGLTETTALHSSESLMSQLQENAANEEFLAKFTDDTLEIFARYQRVDRISIPMLKFLDFLLHDSVITAHLANDSEKQLQILELTKREILRSKDIHKIKAAIDVYCGLLQFEGDICQKAFFLLAILLGHQFPVIRKNTANKLYEATLVNVFVSEEKLERLTELLTETIWENPLAEVRDVRNSICDVLGVARPVVAGASK